jgi:HIRAN domain
MPELEHSSEIPENSPPDSWEVAETYIAGIMYDGRHVIVPRLTLREQVRLRRQPDNAFDSRAVRVERLTGEHLGFVPREFAAQIAPHMDSGGQPIEATVTEIISDASGASFRVRICFRLSKGWRTPSVPSPELEYHHEDSDSAIYVLLNGAEAIFDDIKRKIEADGIRYLRSGLCYRPANNGRQYQWYLKFEKTSGTTQESIDRFFRDHFNVVSDRERAKELEEAKQQYQSEMLELQQQLSTLRQEAKTSEELVGLMDAESRQRISDLEVNVKHLLQLIGNIDDEKRNLRYECDSLKVTLQHQHPNFDARSEDIPDSVSDALLDIVGECLTLSQSLRVISTIFPQRVVVLKTAYDSAAEAKVFREKKRAFELLWKLATEYWTILASGRGDVDGRRVFGNESFSAKESETVERNTRARRLRMFVYKGKKIEMMKHLKIGVKESKAETLRVHFDWDTERRVIVIGHCGKHLDHN